MHRFLILALSLTVAAIAPACGVDGGTQPAKDTGANDTGAPDSGPKGDVSGDSGSSGALACLPAGGNIVGTENIVENCVFAADTVGRVYLIDSLVVTDPPNDALLSQLNTLWASDLENDKLIILFHIISRDDDTGTSLVRVGTGILENGVYRFADDATDMPLNVDECNYSTSEPVALSLNPASLNKPIQLTSVDVCGQTSADATAIPFSYLSGSIRKVDAMGVEVSLNPDAPELTVDLAELLDTFVDMDADTDGDGENDAWSLRGTLTGKAITNFESE